MKLNIKKERVIVYRSLRIWHVGIVLLNKTIHLIGAKGRLHKLYFQEAAQWSGLSLCVHALSIHDMCPRTYARQFGQYARLDNGHVRFSLYMAPHIEHVEPKFYDWLH